jgi:hypothetical protein
MNEFLAQALREFNMALPASQPFFTRLEQLPASQQSRIEQRAVELETAALEAAYEQVRPTHFN